MPEKKGQQAIFIVRTYMYFSMQENKKRHDTRLLADGLTDVHLFVETAVTQRS